MTTKVVDSTVSQLLQDNSSVEYIAPETNPIATVPNETQNRVSANPLFDFNAEHNGVQCIESLRPEDRGTERQYWFSVKFLYEAFEVTDKTIRNKLEKLEKLGEISNCNFLQLLLPDTCKPSTLYDLTVMNKLAMTLDCDKAIEVRKAFNDVLVKHETQAQPTIYDYARALIAEKERSDALEAQNKALTAERDEAIRTKTQYQSNLASQMSGRVGGLTSALNRVRSENDRLKGDRLTVDDIYILMNISDVSFTLKYPKAVIRDSLNLFSKEMGEPFPKVPIKQKEINGKMVDVSGYVYTRKAVQAYFEFVEANPLGWQARNRKMIMYGWLREKLTISA